MKACELCRPAGEGLGRLRVVGAGCGVVSAVTQKTVDTNGCVISLMGRVDGEAERKLFMRKPFFINGKNTMRTLVAKRVQLYTHTIFQ